jgi:hypothetical protein
MRATIPPNVAAQDPDPSPRAQPLSRAELIERVKTAPKQLSMDELRALENDREACWLARAEQGRRETEYEQRRERGNPYAGLAYARKPTQAEVDYAHAVAHAERRASADHRRASFRRPVVTATRARERRSPSRSSRSTRRAAGAGRRSSCDSPPGEPEPASRRLTARRPSRLTRRAAQ